MKKKRNHRPGRPGRPGRRTGRRILPDPAFRDLPAAPFEGVIQKTRGGNAFVKTESGAEVFVHAHNLNGALDGDTAELTYLPKAYWGKHPEGAVSKILSRGSQEVVGILLRDGQRSFVRSARGKDPDAYIRQKDLHGAQPGDRVVCRITRYPDSGFASMEAAVTEILGTEDDGDADLRALIHASGLPLTFSEEAAGQAEAAASLAITSADLDSRVDLRDACIFTIDGPDSKDLDDAVSIEIKADGLWELGVHIADVSHYVKAHTPLDREALERGNSTYLTNFVLPMLPPALSNGACSLEEMEDRLTLSCFMTIRLDGTIVDHKICHSVIRSKARLVYPDVSDLLENDDPVQVEKYSRYNGCDIASPLRAMGELAQVLRERRMRDGSIDFDLPEPCFRLDSDHFACEVFPEERRTANRMIEEFMLAANKTVAEHYLSLGVPFVYRTHDAPSREKQADLSQLLRTMGVRSVPGADADWTPKAVSAVLAEIQGKPSARVIEPLILRAMAKAVYSTECTGHFGLAFPYYCHFTSPIRRYPDLMIHRIINDLLDGPLSPKARKTYARDTETAALTATATSLKSMEVERSADRIRQAQVMVQHIGETFQGTISGISEYGIYVQLPNTAEGVVPLSTLTGEYFAFSAQKHCLIGRRTGTTFTLGDTVTVTVQDAVPHAQEILFELVREKRRKS